MVGASASADSLGEWSLKNLLRGGYTGGIYPVNPRYDELQGQRCYASLDELPEVPDLVIFGVGDASIESALDHAIAIGVPAAVIMSTLYLDNDAMPTLRTRVAAKIHDTGMLVCGANGMGFYNVRDHVWACGFDSCAHEAPGNVSLISQSGSGMSGIIDSEQRLRINVAVSTGIELGVTMDQYLDFVLELPETRVVGLFVETARNPDGFRAALDKARQRRIPIVVLKVGRTEEAARLTVSHSGAMAGDDAAYEALFDRYGVQRVRDMDQLATTLILFAELHPLGNGGLVSLHDSGGERQLMVDLADEANVPLTTLSTETVTALEAVLDPELPAVNPLDAWSRGGPGAGEQMTRSLSLLMQDPGAALGAVIHDRAPDGKVYSNYLAYMRRAHAESGKPVALVGARQGTGFDEAVVTSTHAGFPILDGLPAFLKGVSALFAYRDFLLREQSDSVELDRKVIAKWRARLQSDDSLGEIDALHLFRDFDLPATKSMPAGDANELLSAAEHTGFPLALKTAAEGIAHKSDRGGVVLDVDDEADLRAAYQEMSSRLGGNVVVAPMAEQGVEMYLGVKRDPQFGPVVVLGFGGVLVEIFHDVVFALPPFDAAHARRCVDRLQLRPMLDGVRGRPPADIDAFCVVAARFSAVVDALGDDLEEVDLNPVIVHAKACTIVDALLVTRKST